MSMVSSTSRALYVDSICDKREHLFHDVDSLFCRCFIDDEGRIYSDIGIVAHDDQAALQTFLENELARLFVELLLRLPVLHQLDSDEQAASPDVSDKREFRFEPHELLEHKRTHLRRVFYKPLFDDRL